MPARHLDRLGSESKAVVTPSCSHSQLSCLWPCKVGVGPAVAQTSAAPQKQLDQECKWRKITVPPYLRRWHDLRKSAQAFGGCVGGAGQQRPPC